MPRCRKLDMGEWGKLCPVVGSVTTSPVFSPSVREPGAGRYRSKGRTQPRTSRRKIKKGGRVGGGGRSVHAQVGEEQGAGTGHDCEGVLKDAARA